MSSLLRVILLVFALAEYQAHAVDSTSTDQASYPTIHRNRTVQDSVLPLNKKNEILITQATEESSEADPLDREKESSPLKPILDTQSDPPDGGESIKLEEANIDRPTEPPLNPLWIIPMLPISFILPGSGHYLRGEKETASKIFQAYAYSFGVFLGSALALAASGAADMLSLPFIPLILVSASGWFSLQSADLMGMVSSTDAQEPNFDFDWETSFWVRSNYRRFDDEVFNTKYYLDLAFGYNFDDLRLGANYTFDSNQQISQFGSEVFYRVLPFAEADSKTGVFGWLAYDRELNSIGV